MHFPLDSTIPLKLFICAYLVHIRKRFIVQAIPWLALNREEHHIAIVFDQFSNRADLFIDSVLAGNTTFADINRNKRSLFRIGTVGWNGSEQWGGIINSVAISDKALSLDEFVLLCVGQDTSL